MNLDYEKDNPLLSPTLRAYVGATNRITKHDQKSYLRLATGEELNALENNLKASEMATGFTYLNYSNLMGGLAPALLQKLVEKITSKVYIEESEENESNPLKNKFSNFELSNILEQTFAFSIQTGRAVNVVDFANGKAVVRTFDIFRSKLVKEFGVIKEAFLYITTTTIKSMEAYYVVEHRYFNNANQVCKRYELLKGKWDNEDSFKTEFTIFDKAEKIPQKAKELYPNITFLKEYVLEGFDNLGVFEINNTAYNLLYPYSGIPQSQYQFIQDILVEYDTTRTFKEIDKHLGRGRVVRPEHMQAFAAPTTIGNSNNVARMNMPQFNNVGRDILFTAYPSTKLEDNKPLSVQFDLRTEQWRNEISGLVGDICSAFGLSIVDFDPRLLQTGQRTDDEINAMTDITRSTVEKKRELATESINQMLKLIARLYKVSDNVFIRWSLSSILNPTKNNALISTQLANGTISHEEAVKRANPDYTSKELQEELKRINADKEQAKANTITTQFDEF